MLAAGDIVLTFEDSGKPFDPLDGTSPPALRTSPPPRSAVGGYHSCASSPTGWTISDGTVATGSRCGSRRIRCTESEQRGALLEKAADVAEVDVGVRGPLGVARIVIVVVAHEFPARIVQLVEKLVLPILGAAKVERQLKLRSDP
jgi:hypothetical protein